MTRNDTFFKLLFAIELALLPLIVFAYHFMEHTWIMCLFIAGVLVCRVWMEIFKDKFSFKSNLINAIGSVITLGFVLIFMACVKLISVPLAIVTVVVVVLTNIFKLCLFNKHMPELIEAVDFCFTMFECLTFIALAFVLVSDLVSNIAMFAIIITGAVSIAYKVFYAFKYMDLWINIKVAFKKIFRRK